MKEDLEKTLTKIEKHLSSTEKLIKVIESLEKSLKGRRINEEFENLNKSIKSTKIILDETHDSLSQFKENAKKASEIIKDLTPTLKDFYKNAQNISKGFLGFDTNLTKIGYTLERVFERVKFLGSFFSYFAIGMELLDDYTTVLRRISRSTVTLGDSFNSVILSATKAGMTLENYSRFLEEYAGVINRFGIDATTRMISELRSNAKELFLMGLTVNEVNDYFGRFLEQQRIFDGARTRTERELQDMFREQMMMSYELAKATGRTISDVFKSISERFKDPKSLSILQTLPENIRKEFIKFIELFPSLEDIFLTAVQKGSIEFSEEYRNFATSFLPQLSIISRGLISGTLNAKEAYEILSSAVNSITEDQKRLFALQGENVYNAISRLIFEVNRINKNFGESFSETRMDKISQILLKFQSDLIDFSSTFRTKLLLGLIGDKTPEELEKIFENLREKISKMSDTIISIVKKIIDIFSGEEDKGKTYLEKFFSIILSMLEGIDSFVNMFSRENISERINNLSPALGKLVELIKSLLEGNEWLLAPGVLMLFKSFRSFLFNIGSLLLLLPKLGFQGFKFAVEGVGKLIQRGIANILGKQEISREIIEKITKDAEEESKKAKAEGGDKTSRRGKLANILRKGGRFTLGGLAATIIGESILSLLEEGETKEKISSTITGSGIGATLGGILGSFIPGIGTAIGATLGGVLGGVLGSTVESIEKNIKERIEEINEPIQERTLPPAASLEKTNEELMNIRKGINNLERQFAELNRYSLEGNMISSAILKENKNSNEKMNDIMMSSFFDNIA